MSDDYLVKSGARDLLTLAVAELLAVRPRMPVSFLAAHFQSPANKVAACAHAIRASHSSRTSFQDALMKAFQQLGTSSSPDSGSSLKPLPSSVGPPITTVGPTLRSSAKLIGDHQQAHPSLQHHTKGVIHSGTTLVRREFLKLLECLCDEFPKNLQHRTRNTLQQQNQQSQQVSLDSVTVSFAEFQRGVEVCLLLEELLDVVEDLFQAIDKSETGEVRASALLLALEIAANASRQQQVAPMGTVNGIARNSGSSNNSALLTALKAFVLPSHPLRAQDSPSVSDGATTATGELFNDRTLRLNDMYDAVFHLVFQP